jgi:hypothetical protein
MNQSPFVYIFVTIPSILLNIKWMYHLLKAIPFVRAGEVDKIQIKIAIKYIIISLSYGVISYIASNLIL